MKTPLILALALALGLGLLASGLSACSTVGAGASLDQFNATLDKIATDPHCGHIDRLQGNLGGLTGSNLSVYLERTCPPADAKPAQLQASAAQ